MNVVTIGELMLRLTPPRHERFVQAESFEAVYGGGEANTAVSLSCLGDQAVFVTKLPAHAVGQAAVDALRRYGVDTRHIVRGGERIGIYFMERGADRRPSDIIYDRAHSAFAESSEEEYDWSAIFARADWLHLTGITPALGKSAAGIALRAIHEAKKLGIPVSFDVNYRAKLWSEEEARPVLTSFAALSDVIITNVTQAKELFLLEGGDDEALAAAVREKYGCKKVAFTFRRTLNAERNVISAALFDGEALFRAPEYEMHMIDRIGGGDAFSAGLIHALGKGMKAEEAVCFAEAASCLKHSVEGDMNLVTEGEVFSLMHSSSPRVLR